MLTERQGLRLHSCRLLNTKATIFASTYIDDRNKNSRCIFSVFDRERQIKLKWERTWAHFTTFEQKSEIFACGSRLQIRLQLSQEQTPKNTKIMQYVRLKNYIYIKYITFISILSIIIFVLFSKNNEDF
jgi:hypothetical protein